MNKRLKLTETQFQKIKKFIFESSFDLMFKNYTKKGDLIIVNTEKEIIKFKVVDVTDKGIFMINVRSVNLPFNKLVYFAFDSFKNNILKLKIANDEQSKQNPLNPDTWKETTINNTKSIDIFRNNQLVDSTDNSKNQQNTEQPDSDNETPQGTDDSTDGSTDGSNDEELIEKGKIAYRQILNDPILKKAFYKKPSFWNLFVSGLKDKKATGKGIVPTLQMLDKYNFQKMDKTFVPRKNIYFKVLNAVQIFDDNNNIKATFSPNLEYMCFVTKQKIDNKLVLENKQYDFKVQLLYEEANNTFVCNLIKYYFQKGGGYIEYKTKTPVKIQILKDKSDGYNTLGK